MPLLAVIRGRGRRNAAGVALGPPSPPIFQMEEPHFPQTKVESGGENAFIPSPSPLLIHPTSLFLMKQPHFLWTAAIFFLPHSQQSCGVK